MKKLKYMNNLDDIRLTKEFIFLNPYKFIIIFTYLIISLIIGVSILLSFTNKQETVEVQGILELSNKAQDIQVLVDGVVDEVHIQDGDYVENGEIIFSLRSDKLEIQKSDLNEKLKKAKEQQEYLIQLEDCINNRENTFQNNETEGVFYSQVEKYLSQIRTFEIGGTSSEYDALISQKNNLQELLNSMKNNEDLYANHNYYSQLELYRSKLSDYKNRIDQIQKLIDNETNPEISAQYQQQLDTLNNEKNKFVEQNQLEIQQQIDTLNSKIKQVQNSIDENEKKIEAEIENLRTSSLAEIKDNEQQLQNNIGEYENSLAAINIDLNSYNVQATKSGYVSYKSEIKKDTVLSAGTLVGFLTSTKGEMKNFEVTLNVPSSGVGFVEIGQNVKITVNGLDRKDYGFINGTVNKIYESPIQVKNNIYYQVTASIDIGQNESIYKDLFNLKDNMIIQANIITKETSWLTYLLEKMNIFKDTDENI